MRVNYSLPALKKKLNNAENKLKRLKDKRPLMDRGIRNTDRSCIAHMEKVYKQMEKVEDLRRAVELVEHTIKLIQESEE